MDAESGNIDELAASIKTHGLLQPPTVFPVNGRYEVAYGDRRTRACKKIGMERIPCIVVDDPSTLTLVLRLTENIQRLDLSPIEEGANLKELQDTQGWGYKILAAHVGKSVMWVRDRLHLLELPPDITILVHQKLIGINHGLLLGKITDAPTRIQYAQETIQNGTGISTLKLWVELWEHTQESPMIDTEEGEDPRQNIQPQEHMIRCQVCEDYFKIHQLMSVIICRGCVQTIQEAKHGDATITAGPEPSNIASDPGLGNQGGETTHQG